MNLQEAAKKLHTAFLSRMGVKLETVKTKDGAELEIEGGSVFIVSSEGERITAPDGEYELEGGRSIEVKEGRIVEIEKEEEELKSINMTKEEVEAMIDEKMTALKEELKSELMEPKQEEEAAKEEKAEEVEASKEEPSTEEKKEEAVELSAEEEAAPLKGAPVQEEVALSSEKEDLSGMSYEERIFAQISKFSK